LITSEHLPMGITSVGPATGAAAATSATTTPSPVALPGAVTLDAAEREMIAQALAKAGQNKSKAARMLGLTRAQLRSRIEKHGLEDVLARNESS
jgi:transcriptional regulator with GAF, ATPase, and Fis domain